MSRTPSLILWSFLFIAATFIVASTRGVAGANVSLPPVPAPSPARAGEPPPWYTAEAMDAAETAAKDELKNLGNEMAAAEAEKKANVAKQKEIGAAAGPKADEFEKAKAALNTTKGEISQHDGRCHNSKLEPGPYQTCLTEHGTLDSKYSGQATTYNGLIDQLKGLKSQWDKLGAENEELQKRIDAANQKKVKVEEQLATIAKLKEQLESCNTVWNRCRDGVCSKGFSEALKHCYSIYWDGASAGLPPLSDNPRLPFFAQSNIGGGGDGSTVDTRGVRKMTEAERAAELAKPRVQPPKGRGGSPPPPPPPPPPKR